MPCFSLNRDVVSTTVTVVADNGTLNPTVQAFTVAVPTGKVPVSAGFKIPFIGTNSPNVPVTSYGHYPSSDGTGWVFQFRSTDSSTDHAISVYVVYIDA